MAIARMSPTIRLLLALAGLSIANEFLLLPRAGDLSARQVPSGICNYGDGQSCSQCFGEGYVLCSYIGCYNPTLHQQCCGDASYCVAANNSCCDPVVGPGVSGTDGTPVSTPPTPLPTDTGDTSFACTKTDTGEECCQRGGSGEHWCSGTWPNYNCYVPKTGQSCCSNGVVCDGDDCCSLIGAKATTPFSVISTAAKTAPPEGPTSGHTATGAAGTSTATPTKSSNAAAFIVADGLVMAVLGLQACVMGIAFL